MAAKTIVLKGKGMRSEAIANAAGILPGHLVQLMSTGKIRVHPTATGNAEKAFAVEDDLQGKIISDAYAIASIAQYEVFPPGAEVNAIIANGQIVVIGSMLESAGNGELQVHVPDTEALFADSSGDVSPIYTAPIIGYAMEAVDMSGSTGADPTGRCRIRIA